MKRTLALSFALSLLTATGAFASTSSTSSATHSPVPSAQRLDTASYVVEAAAAGAGNKTFDRAAVNLDKKVLIAENRKEFGSQYQRY
jgi:hypothetical protein